VLYDIRYWTIFQSSFGDRREGIQRTDTAWLRSAGRVMRFGSKNSDGGRKALRRVSCESVRRRDCVLVNPIQELRIPEFFKRTPSDLMVLTARRATSMLEVKRLNKMVERGEISVFFTMKRSSWSMTSVYLFLFGCCGADAPQSDRTDRPALHSSCRGVAWLAKLSLPLVSSRLICPRHS
jgi:hypothetical protein